MYASHCSVVQELVHTRVFVALINRGPHTLSIALYSDLMCMMAELYLAVRRLRHRLGSTDISRNGAPTDKQEGVRKWRTLAFWEGGGVVNWRIERLVVWWSVKKPPKNKHTKSPLS